MFDGLKDKLGQFREDVEEETEEKVEESEGNVEEADVEATEGTDTGVEAEPEPEPQSEPETDPGAKARDEGGTRAGTAAGPGDGDAGAETGDDADADADADTDADADADDGGGSEPGLATRAKAMATGQVIIEESDLEEPLWDLEMALLGSDVEMSVAEEILRAVEDRMVGETRKQIRTTGDLAEEALREALIDVISVGQFDFEERIAAAEKPVTIVFTGVNGVGKTTTIAKLSEWFDERGYSSVLANGDTYRAGANEQIREHAEALDRRLISHEKGGDPAAVIYDAVEYADANDVDVVLGDTAGRLHTSNDLMAQLEKIDRVVEPDMTLFVDEAVAGQDAVERAKEFDAAAEIDGAILTKADADAQGGAAISIAHVTGKPILFLGTGQEYDDLERFDPEWLVDQLLGE